MYLIVGLGNPDKKYEKTFHNMGYIAVGDAAELLGAKFKKKECEASVAETHVNGEKVILARPLTYMNNSGRAVKQLMAKYKIEESNLIVIYDDYDLPKGKVRIRANGSAGTHNGMRSIIGETGLKNFPRIRIGIRDEEVDIPIINYVLSDVRKDDYPLFADACHKAGEAAAEFARGLDIEKVMCKFN
ncbi:MAG: aminoacyl-tRNA hydrolase [Clostridiales bacterium]|nr:aminoacyl-tRNA hydrolase [Clostridiales bacterium]